MIVSWDKLMVGILKLKGMFSSFAGFTYFVIGAIALCEQEMHNMYGFGSAWLFLALFLLLILDL